MIKYIYKDKGIVAQKFADSLVEKVNTSEVFHWSLSGGSTPKLLFSLLAERYADKIEWNKVHFYWGDERCVPPTDEDSNYKMTKERLFDPLNIAEKNIHRIMGESEPAEEAKRHEEELKNSLPLNESGLPVFDLIMLGMGDDGHTASIFPHEMQLLDSSNICEVATHPVSGQKRITITGEVINAAKEIAFLVTGENKAEKIDDIFYGKERSKTYPAYHIKPSSGKLAWYLDSEAASQL